MAATSQPLATLAALDMLRRGGSAADGAIAAAAVLAVVEPAATGVGGDAFCLIATREGVEGYNGSGRAPAALAMDRFAGSGLARIPVDSAHAVTIPGAVDCWMALLERYGRLNKSVVLAPAIDYALNGFAVTPRIAYEWNVSTPKLSACGFTANHFLPGGRAPRAGEVFRNPALGATLQQISAHGNAGFYEGEIAADMTASLKSLGGTHTVADFAKHTGNWVTPARSTYRGVEMFEIPPNGQGVTTLLLLNILENFDLGALEPFGPERFHLEGEASRLAYMERDRCIADPDNATVDVAHFTDKAFAKKLAESIDPKRAGAGVTTARKGDTTYLCVADENGMMVSFINSIYHGFGSGLSSEKTGVLFQNRGHGFRLDETHPNVLRGGKRPFHTIIPAMARKDGQPWLAFGVMGGDFQPVGQSHVLTGLVDWNMDIQEAIDAPRGFLFNDAFSLEQGVPEATRAALAAMGHTIVTAPEPLGGGQGIMRDFEHDTWIGGSEPRKDGCALGY